MTMEFVYPLLHVLIYIAMSFAPAGVGRVEIEGPKGPVVLTRAEGGWHFHAESEGVEGSASLQNGSLALKAKGETRAMPVLPYLAAAVGNDWTKHPKVPLEYGASLEKAGGGFDFTREGERYRIRFVTPKEAVSPGVNVLGAVTRPGRYPLVEGATVASVLELAGGTTEEVDLSNSRILRGKAGERATVRPIDPEKPDEMELRDGDTVYVPRREARGLTPSPAMRVAIVRIASDGALTLDGEPCSIDKLGVRLKKLASARSLAVEINADPKALHARVLGVTNACARAGVQDVRFRVDPQGAAEPR